MKTELIELLAEVDDEFIPILTSRLRLEEYIDKLISKSIIIPVYNGGELTAFIAFYCNDLEKRTAYLSMLAVRKNYRNKGLGRMLLQSAISIVQNMSFKSFALEVHKANVNAISLYKAFGFFVEAENQSLWFMQKNVI